MNNLIFGKTWEEIQEMQSRTCKGKPLPAYNEDAYKADIVRDVERFKIPVYDSVKRKLNIELPEGYELIGEIWKFNA